MKIRTGFVSNSSTSSFTCHVCGETWAGRDMSMREFGLVSCEHGHVFCEEHLIGIVNERECLLENLKDALENPKGIWMLESIKETEKILEEFKNNKIDEDTMEDLVVDYEVYYVLPEKYCPICQFESLMDEDYVAYIAAKYGFTVAKITDEIKNNFSNYSEFLEFCKEGDVNGISKKD